MSDGTDFQKPLPVDVIARWKDGASTVITVFCKTEHLPAPLWRHHTPLTEFSQFHIPSEGLDFQGWAGEVEELGPAAFMAAAWVLMFTPTVVEARPHDPKTGESGPNIPKDRTVTTISLRPLKYVESESDKETGRVYKHRWIVRGHWRNQACGANQEDRELTWIASYIKGPKNAPLLATEKVVVWRG